MFSRNKATFLLTTDIKPWEGCHKCSLEVQRNILEKKAETLEKLFLKNNFGTFSQKLSADLKTAFVVCNGTCWGKSGSRQRGILFVPTLDSEQKTLGSFVKTLLEASRATILRKKCFLEETLFILNWDLEWETIGRVVKLASYMTTKKNWSKTCFFKKAIFSCFFSFLRVNDFRQSWEPQSTKHVRDLVKRFQHGFQSWIQGFQKNILRHNIFCKSQTFIINSGFWAIT